MGAQPGEGGAPRGCWAWLLPTPAASEPLSYRLSRARGQLQVLGWSKGALLPLSAQPWEELDSSRFKASSVSRPKALEPLSGG